MNNKSCSKKLYNNKYIIIIVGYTVIPVLDLPQYSPPKKKFVNFRCLNHLSFI